VVESIPKGKFAYERQNATLIQAAEMKFLRTSKEYDKIKNYDVPIWKELYIFMQRGGGG
jgi:hypothetical protein